MRAVSIGNLSFIAFEDRQPASWSPDADALRKVEMLGVNLHGI
ncbi:hypothetical protein C7402_103134 [Paraburkholderia unamae]|uniref:Sugar phosphate isomerase/epimerase n=1 Tax=Paraburkholderia unamae TaxID=219649 RepID=A0ABX5KRQ2_9BURK|nr:hypothetical protein C7402_103134 [Paraburkholderia unamae]RAR55234.1 hypothetical protein C7401_1229 [Paraburkholderia unamae]